MISFGQSLSSLKPLLEWAVQTVSNIPSDVVLAQSSPSSESKDSVSADNSSFTYPAKVLRILAMIFFELNASFPGNKEIIEEQRNVVPVLIQIMGHTYQTCRRHIARLLLIIIQNNIQYNDDRSNSIHVSKRVSYIQEVCELMLAQVKDVEEGEGEEKEKEISLVERRRETILHLLSHSSKTDCKKYISYLYPLIHILPKVFSY